MTNLEIEIRSASLSIQGDNLSEKVEAAKKLLKAALEALETKPIFTAKNELLFQIKK